MPTVATAENDTRTGASLAGSILNVTEDGRVRKDTPILDVLYKNELERFIPKMMASTRPSRGEVLDDVTHLNDVEPLGSAIADEYPLFDAGDLLISLRHLNLVFVFDPETLTVKWHASGRNHEGKSGGGHP